MASSCEHLRDLTTKDFAAPKTPDACEDCLNEGTSAWVSLRQCQCGHVGCCDSSPGKHATRHFKQTQHPVMRSIMPGQNWDWCYVHEVKGDLAG